MTGSAEGLPFGDEVEATSPDGFAAALDRLRRRAAHGTGRTRVSLEQLAVLTGIPRSTVHSYLRGRRLPPADVLDRIVLALGATPTEQRRWADALDRLLSQRDARSVTNPTRTPVAPSGHTQIPRLLPAAPAGFTGRKAESERLDVAIADHDTDGAAPLVVCLTGTGGVGKTALALSWAHRNTDRFPDGQLWIDLRGYAPGTPVDPSDALARLLRAIGVGTAELPGDIESRADLFRSSMAGMRMLVVLDNARDSAQILPLLAGSRDITTLITSRNSLRSLAAAIGATRLPVDRLPDDDAESLLTARLDPLAAETVRSSGLAAHCGGLPLALRIVRERLDPGEPGDITRFAVELSHAASGVLSSLELNDTSADLSVRSTFDWSYDALSPGAARLFRLLPLCLASTFDLDTAAALCGVGPDETRRLVEQLVSAHLLDPAGDGFVRIHDLVASYAQQRLEAEEGKDEQLAVRDRFFNHVLDRCERAIEVLTPDVPWRLTSHARTSPGAPFVDAGAVHRWIVQHADVFARAARSALADGADEYACLLAERSWRVLFAQGSVTDLSDILTAAGERAEARGDIHAAITMARQLGIGLGRAVQLGAAEQAFRRASTLALADVTRFGVDRAMLAGNLALVRALKGDLRGAISMLEDSLDTGLPAGSMSIDVRWTLLTLTEMYLQAGDLARAETYLRKYEELPRESSNWRTDFYEVPADVAIARGDWKGARERLAFCITGGAVDASTKVGALTRLARASAADGDLAAAVSTVVDARRLARRVGCRSREIGAAVVHAEVLTLAGKVDEAILRLRPEVERSRGLGLRYVHCQTLAVLARAQTAAGAISDAVDTARRAAAIADECGYRMLAAEIDGDLPDGVSRAFLSW